MVQKPKAVKYKVIIGYILLLGMAALSVWLVYTEILKMARPGQNNSENQTIISISNAIADLYTSEALGRKAILSESDADYKKYNELINSIHYEIQDIKKGVEASQVSKFESIQLLLNRKRNSVKEIRAYHKEHNNRNTLTRTIQGIYDTKDSIVKTAKPVEVTQKYKWQKTINNLLTQRAKDSLNRPEVSNDSLAIAFDKILTTAFRRERKLDNELFIKEQQLLEENRIISEQLREILASVEQEFIKKTYTQIDQAQAGIEKTIKNIAWIGAITLLILIVFAWIILRDLNINQNYRKQLEVLNNKNEALLRTKSMLMATVTHDLQTPLGSIIGFHDLIKDSGITSKQQQYLGNIKESANYILKLVNDLLDFSKLENNRISIEKTAFNIKTVIENTCKTLEPMALNKGIELNWDINEELNANFISDPYRIKQVLTNLISNAIKFTPDGSVEVTGKIEDNTIQISVIDTGIGISRTKHADVFKEFTQAHAGIEKKFGGTGLGLTISKKILELLDGEISLESEEGQGSIFTITIPCLPATNNFTSETALDTEDNRSYPQLENKKILIIDDDIMQLTLMQELLLNYPVIVKTEINAASVISILENEPFDIILTDIQMPSIDGFELVKLIRSNQDSTISKLPVIALSGKRDLTPKDFTDGGFNAHHAKPIHLEELLDLISGMFGDEKTKEKKAVIIEPADEYDTKPLYNLRSLAQFTSNDQQSLNTILKTFIDSAVENCIALQHAVKHQNEISLSDTSHKMIPMLKQMEVYSIVKLLEPLEDRNHTMDWPAVELYVDDICDRTNTLCEAFKDEINQSSIL